MAPNFNIISCDGGGIRGVYTARLLHRLLELEPALLESTSLFAGTSTGAIIALGLAHGLQPSDLERLYRDQGRAIFRRRTLGGFWGAKYSSDGLRAALLEAFGSTTELRQLQRLVLIPAYQLDAPAARGRPRGSRPRFFESVGDARELVVDVALASSAAPTFFPSHNGFVDGGVVCNNPAAAAVTEALKYGVPPDRLRILSVGTGLSSTWIEGKRLDWGILRWAPRFASAAIDGSAGVHEQIVEKIFRDQAHRLAGQLSRPVELDDVDAIAELLEEADKVDLTNVTAWLRQVEWES